MSSSHGANVKYDRVGTECTPTVSLNTYNIAMWEITHLCSRATQWTVIVQKTSVKGTGSNGRA